MKRTKKILIYTVFAAYTLVMLWLLFGQRLQVYISGTWTENYWEDFLQKINLIPFHTIAEFWDALQNGSRSHAFINLAGNVVLFVPLGFLLPRVFPKAKTFGGCMLLVFLIMLCVEILQLVTLLGSFDVDDLILNIIGAAVGYVLYAAVRAIQEKKNV